MIGPAAAAQVRTTRDFILSPQVEALTAAIWRDIDAANGAGAGSRVEQVHRFTILPSELTLAGGELSPSMKLKRFYICRKYSEQIDAMYANDRCVNRCANLTGQIAPSPSKDEEDF